MSEYHSIDEVRAACYPRCARLLDLPPGALIGLPDDWFLAEVTEEERQ